MSEDLTVAADTTLRLLVEGQRVFGRFVLERILGRGGMGVVWKAQDTVLEKEVALKFILDSQASDPDAVANLKRETRRCQELRHAGIVAIYDLHQEGGRVAVSMEYVVGETLAALKVDRPTRCFDAEDVQPWLDQLGAALTYAHEEARVVHRDIKPSNLILTSTGRLKVMDFGISQPLAATLASTTGTRNYGISLPYGSPQQLIGDRARVADDVYSLGATIYDLLTGTPPFFRGKIDLQVLEVVPPSMTERRAELKHEGGPIPKQWEDVVAAALSKEPSDRPASIAAMVAALRDGWEHRSEGAPVVKISVPKAEAPVPSTAEVKVPTTTTRPSVKVDTVTTVGWVPTPASKSRPIRDASWQMTAVFVLGMAALTALGIRWVRHSSPPAPVPVVVAPVVTPEPEKPRPDPLRAAALQPVGVKPPPRPR